MLDYSQKSIKESQQSQRTDFVRFGGTFKVYYNLVFIRTNVQEILISNTTFFSYSYWPHSLKIVIFALRNILPTKKNDQTTTYRKHVHIIESTRFFRDVKHFVFKFQCHFLLFITYALCCILSISDIGLIFKIFLKANLKINNLVDQVISRK